MVCQLAPDGYAFQDWKSSGGNGQAKDGGCQTGRGVVGRAQRRKPRRRLSPDVRRAELIDAALRVLRKRGGAASRVEDVTSAAFAGKGTFYLYFSSWEDLLVALRDRILDDFGAKLQARLAELSKVDWWTLLDELCAGFVTSCWNSAAFTMLSFTDRLPVNARSMTNVRRHIG